MEFQEKLGIGGGFCEKTGMKRVRMRKFHGIPRKSWELKVIPVKKQGLNSSGLGNPAEFQEKIGNWGWFPVKKQGWEGSG